MTDDVSQSDLDDAIIEDTCHCDLCGASFLVGDNDCVIVTLDNPVIGWNATPIPIHFGGPGGQLKLCVECARRVHDVYRENLRNACVCEHGVADGEYCEPCNAEYKRARRENAIDTEE